MSSTSPAAHLSFFDLQEQPFAPTADPRYFYSSRSHKECLFRLWNTIDERHGIAIVLGNAGTGKTMLLRKLLAGMEAAPDQYNTAVIGSAFPSWNTQALLEAMLAQFGLSPSPPTLAGCIELLNGYLLANHGRINTLVIDDAQNLNKRGQLEVLRLIQNLETQQYKLLNVVLFAQLEWLDVLWAASGFAQRADVAFTLEAMASDETAAFIDFRLRAAAAPFPLFDEDAIAAIHAYAAGNPRVTVTLCRNALLAAARIQDRSIGADIISYTIEKTVAALPEPQPKAEAEAAPPMPADEAEAPVAGPGIAGALTSAREARATRLLRAMKAKQDTA